MYSSNNDHRLDFKMLLAYLPITGYIVLGSPLCTPLKAGILNVQICRQVFISVPAPP